MPHHAEPLTAAQLRILAAAALRPDHAILPPPSTARARVGAPRPRLAALLQLGLVEQVPVDEAALAWRMDEAGPPLGLRLTAAGLSATGAPSTVAPAPVCTAAANDGPASGGGSSGADTPTTPSSLRYPVGKLGEVVQAVSAEAGATLAEITSLTGWQPHTARAALTGLRRRGFVIQLGEREGRKAYRLTAAG